MDDRNDNTPQWIFPNDENPTNIFTPYNGSEGPIAQFNSDSIYIPWNANIGMVIGHLQAEDPDLGKNSLLSFQYAPMNSNQYGLPVDEFFAIDEQRGAITVIKKPGEFCDQLGSMAVLDVSVSDHGTPARQAVSELYLILYNCEDYQPEGRN